MKLNQLYLKAFGPFTDREPLDFDAVFPGLHIIYGPNEAGKSSSLRALRALLYGFDHQTPDNFIHSYDQLLVGGCLENDAGQKIVFFRRKKRVNDIVDEAGDPLDPGILAPFLSGVEPNIFESLYGIDHDRLVRGGKDILDQKGELGQALFAAGAGMSSLQNLISRLENEAKALFKPSGQNPEINQAIKRFKELQKRAREKSLSYRDWKKHKDALTAAEKTRDDLEKERDHLNRKLQGLARLQQAIPELASLASREKQQQDLGEVPPLTPDFEKQVDQVSREMQAAEQQLQKDRERKKILAEKLAAIQPNEGLLCQAELVNDFVQRLGEFRKGQKDRPRLDGMRISLRREAAQLLQQVRPDVSLDALETLGPVLQKKRTIQRLSAQYEATNQQMTSAEKHLDTAACKSRDLKTALADKLEPKDVSPLVRAVKLARKAGDIDQHLEKSVQALGGLKNECRSDLQRMGMWSGDLADLMQLPLPLSETLQAFENRFAIVSDALREVEKSRKAHEKELLTVTRDISKLVYAGQVPTEQDLVSVREKRDQGWLLLRRQWLEKEDVAAQSTAFDPDLPLPDAYEGYVGKADMIADRLWREADRVATAAGLQAREQGLKTALTDNDKEEQALVKQSGALEKEWRRVWAPAGITPLSPKEMGGWLAQMDQLRFKVKELFKNEHQVRQDTDRQKALVSRVKSALHLVAKEKIPAQETLDPVLVFAETVIEDVENRKKARDLLDQKMQNAQTELQQARQDLAAAQKAWAVWETQWHKAVLHLGVKSDVSPMEAVDMMETLQQCFDRHKEADDMKKRIQGIDRDAADLEKAVNTLVEKVAPQLTLLPLDQRIIQLQSLLNQAQKDRILHDKIGEELDLLEKEADAAQEKHRIAQARMQTFLSTARCSKPEDLPEAINRFVRFQQLQQKISDTKAVLAKIGAGVDRKTLAEQAAAVEADELPAMIAALEKDISQRIHPAINAISQVIGEENTRLAAMDGNATAAEIAEEMEQELAMIRRLSDRYTITKLAAGILQQEIEHYREAHQDPVLQLASRYFHDLTQGSFAGLRTDVDDRAEPVLVGVRQENVRLTVEKMSSGTRDQLFLALRLATLEWRLEKTESMPFIVDDILINFDDARSRATLEVLAELSRKTQVILFTHHRQIVQAAEQITDKNTIHIHEL